MYSFRNKQTVKQKQNCHKCPRVRVKFETSHFTPSKDFKNTIVYAGAFLQGNIITIYLDDNPNSEKNLINKLIRTKYSSSLKKINSAEDVMKFKIV